MRTLVELLRKARDPHEPDGSTGGDAAVCEKEGRDDVRDRCRTSDPHVESASPALAGRCSSAPLRRGDPVSCDRGCKRPTHHRRLGDGGLTQDPRRLHRPDLRGADLHGRREGVLQGRGARGRAGPLPVGDLQGRAGAGPVRRHAPPGDVLPQADRAGAGREIHRRHPPRVPPRAGGDQGRHPHGQGPEGEDDRRAGAGHAAVHVRDARDGGERRRPEPGRAVARLPRRRAGAGAGPRAGRRGGGLRADRQPAAGAGEGAQHRRPGEGRAVQGRVLLRRAGERQVLREEPQGHAPPRRGRCSRRRSGSTPTPRPRRGCRWRRSTSPPTSNLNAVAISNLDYVPGVAGAELAVLAVGAAT